jgi:hypothetical protein
LKRKERVRWKKKKGNKKRLLYWMKELILRLCMAPVLILPAVGLHLSHIDGKPNEGDFYVPFTTIFKAYAAFPLSQNISLG